MNIVDFVLNELKIKHSETFIQNNYEDSPDYDNMLGIQRILSRYGIETIGVRLKEKKWEKLTFPCIMHLKNQIVIATGFKENVIKYYNGKRNKSEQLSIFNKKWTGHALLVEKTKNAKEPEYIKNKFTDICSFFANYFFIFIVSVLGIITLADDGIATSKSVNVLLDLFGLCLCALLFQKQLFSQSPIADKFCSMLQKEGCDPILSSNEAKFLDFVSWAEIGLTYFSSRIIFSYLHDGHLAILQIIGWLAMPYGIWSIWHQAYKTKHWCLLCTVIQITIWTAGIYNVFFFKYENMSYMDIVELIILGTVVLLFVHTLSELHSFKGKYRNTNKDLLKFKSLDHIFEAALINSKEIEINDETSSIIYGNKSASKTLTVLTNPHCTPCAGMHQRLMKLIKENRDIKIQYIYSSFNEEVEASSLMLIAAYQQKSYDEALKILEQWYEAGRFTQEEFIKGTGLDIYHSDVLEEYSKHSKWKKVTGIEPTPTIIYKGHELPSFYSVEDFIYLDIEKEVPSRT